MSMSTGSPPQRSASRAALARTLLLVDVEPHGASPHGRHHAREAGRRSNGPGASQHAALRAKSPVLCSSGAGGRPRGWSNRKAIRHNPRARAPPSIERHRAALAWHEKFQSDEMTSYFGRATESVRNSTTLPLMLRLIGCSYVVGKYVAHFTMVRTRMGGVARVRIVCMGIPTHAVQCEGPSMLPTVSVRGDILLHESVSYRTRRPLQVGDVVICKANDRPERQVVKRIVGLVRVNTPVAGRGSLLTPAASHRAGTLCTCLQHCPPVGDRIASWSVYSGIFIAHACTRLHCCSQCLCACAPHPAGAARAHVAGGRQWRQLQRLAPLRPGASGHGARPRCVSRVATAKVWVAA